MSAFVGPVRIIPSKVTNLQHRWLTWRLRRVSGSRDPLHLRLAAIQLERIEIEGHCSLENPNKHDQLAELKEEKSRLARKLEPLDESYRMLCRIQARFHTLNK